VWAPADEDSPASSSSRRLVPCQRAMAARIAWAERKFLARFRISSSGRPGWNRRASDMKRSSAAARAIAVAALRSRTRAQRSWAARRASVARSAVRIFLLPNSGRPQPRTLIPSSSKAPNLCICGGGPGLPPLVGKSKPPPSRRDGGTRSIDRPRPNSHTADLDDRQPGRPQRPAERWLPAESTRRVAAVAASPPRGQGGGRQSRPAASSDRSRTGRR